VTERFPVDRAFEEAVSHSVLMVPYVPAMALGKSLIPSSNLSLTPPSLP